MPTLYMFVTSRYLIHNNSNSLVLSNENPFISRAFIMLQFLMIKTECHLWIVSPLVEKQRFLMRSSFLLIFDPMKAFFPTTFPPSLET